jgi:hypothetical protein
MLRVDKRYIKELTIDEFKQLINETIAENIQMWHETFEIMTNKEIMRQIISAEEALAENHVDEFLDWEEVREDV